jgi:hypothetical protein
MLVPLVLFIFLGLATSATTVAGVGCVEGGHLFYDGIFQVFSSFFNYLVISFDLHFIMAYCDDLSVPTKSFKIHYLLGGLLGAFVVTSLGSKYYQSAAQARKVVEAAAAAPVEAVKEAAPVEPVVPLYPRVYMDANLPMSENDAFQAEMSAFVERGLKGLEDLVPPTRSLSAENYARLYNLVIQHDDTFNQLVHLEMGGEIRFLTWWLN